MTKYFKKTLLITIIVTVIILFFGTGLINYNNNKNKEYGAKVSLGNFSGRPDPCWQLSVSETLQLVSMINSLPEVKEIYIPAIGLGYRSFDVLLLIDTKLNNNKYPVNIKVYKDIVVYNTNEKNKINLYSYPKERNTNIVYKKDEDKKIELWLLESGRHIMDSELYSIMKESLK